MRFPSSNCGYILVHFLPIYNTWTWWRDFKKFIIKRKRKTQQQEEKKWNEHTCKNNKEHMTAVCCFLTAHFCRFLQTIFLCTHSSHCICAPIVCWLSSSLFFKIYFPNSHLLAFLINILSNEIYSYIRLWVIFSLTF